LLEFILFHISKKSKNQIFPVQQGAYLLKKAMKNIRYSVAVPVILEENWGRRMDQISLMTPNPKYWIFLKNLRSKGTWRQVAEELPS
jgi:hypothetical protein